MEIASLIEPLESAIANPDLHSYLGKLADCMANNGPTPEIPEEICQKSFRIKLLENNATPTFTSKITQALFYAIHLTQTKINKSSSDDSVITFLNALHKSSFGAHYANSWPQIREIVYLVVNRIYDHDIPRLIAERKLSSKSVLRAYWDLLPYFNSSVENLVNALFLSTTDITAEGNYINLNASVRLRSKNQTEFGFKLIEQCKASRQKLDLFFMHAFHGLSQTTGIQNAYLLLKDMLNSPNKDFVVAGLRTLAWLHGNNDHPEEIADQVIPVLDKLTAKNDDQLTQNIIFAYGLLIDKITIARTKLESLISDQLGPDSRFALSHLISIYIKNRQEEIWFKKSLALLVDLKGQHVGTYVNLSNSFAYAFEAPPGLFYTYIDKFIEDDHNEIKTIEGFRNAFEESFSKDKDQFERWLTRAFNNENRRFHQAAREVLLMIDRKASEIRLSKEIILTLTPYDLEFILYKIVGNVYAKEHLQSLVYSALEYVDESGLVPQLVTELMALYIMYNYPGVINYLKEKKQTANATQASVITIIEQHYNEIHRIQEKKPLELAPSSSSLQKLFRKYGEQISDFKDESPFRQPRITDFITHITIVKGNSFFHRDGDYGAIKNKFKSRSNMGRVAVEFEMPGGEFVDPVGQEYNRHYWRTFKRRIQ